MQFEEKRAAEIAAAWGLSHNTVKAWRQKKVIPKRYSVPTRVVGADDPRRAAFGALLALPGFYTRNIDGIPKYLSGDTEEQERQPLEQRSKLTEASMADLARHLQPLQGLMDTLHAALERTLADATAQDGTGADTVKIAGVPALVHTLNALSEVRVIKHYTVLGQRFVDIVTFGVQSSIARIEIEQALHTLADWRRAIADFLALQEKATAP